MPGNAAHIRKKQKEGSLTQSDQSQQSFLVPFPLIYVQMPDSGERAIRTPVGEARSSRLSGTGG
ncbi:MAG TPA: hypothetical protein VFT45_14840 [Longimicrobium sp.]|nr:hypothetical protein [Longimicrobium sp.]